jgi:hypothetical protein
MGSAVVQLLKTADDRGSSSDVGIGMGCGGAAGIGIGCGGEADIGGGAAAGIGAPTLYR